MPLQHTRSEARSTSPSVKAATEAITALKWRAMEGDAVAAEELIAHAQHACKAVRWLWSPPITVAKSRERRSRQVLKTIASQLTAFPTLCFADVNQQRRSDEMLSSLALGNALPFKFTRRHADYANYGVSWLITARIYPRFLSIRGGQQDEWLPNEPDLLQSRIRNLPPLSMKTAAHWVDAATDWLLEMDGPRCDKLMALARPEKRLGKRTRASLRKIDQMFGGIDDPVGLTNKQARLAVIKSRRPTTADLRASLRQILAERMRSLLKK